MAELERIEKEKKAAETIWLAKEEAARKAIEEKAKHMAERAGKNRKRKEGDAAEAKRLAEEEAARKAIEEKAKRMEMLDRIKLKIHLEKVFHQCYHLLRRHNHHRHHLQQVGYKICQKRGIN